MHNKINLIITFIFKLYYLSTLCCYIYKYKLLIIL